MSLAPGTRLGPYTIVGVLGAGGMGEVYRARDTQLDRDVAIKVLPDTLARDPERLLRFEREAKSLAAINHPHIAQIYGLHDGAIVMELVEGRTLEDRIAETGAPGSSGAPWREALEIADQIANALEAAHGQGIVHRDLKPANIKVRPDGTVKVLDFGLAKALDPGATSSGDGEGRASDSPTITSPATGLGVILGTAAYMSPEQARGRPVDRRADVWAFGVVLFELLTGRRFFAGETISDTLAAVLRQDIPWASLPPDVPAGIRAVLAHCLERDPRRRLRDAGDLRLLLADAAAAAPERANAPTIATRGAWARIAALLVGVAGLAGFAGWWLAHAPATATTVEAVVQFSVSPPADVRGVSNVTLSDDGRVLVYQGYTDRGASGLWVRRLDTLDSRPIAGTEGANAPFLSPDGRSVGFFREGKLWRVLLAGGDVLPICDGRGGPGAVWLPDGKIVFAKAWLDGLWEVADQGGQAVRLTTVNQQDAEKGHWFPARLPDGRLLFTVFKAGGGLNDNRLAVWDPNTRTHQTFLAGSRATWLPSGHLLFYRAGRFHTIPFDLTTLAPTGDSTPVLEDATGLDPIGDSPQPVMAAPNGALAYVPGELVPSSTLAWVGSGQATTSLSFPARRYAEVALSADGTRAAVSSLEDGRMIVRVLDLARQTDEVVGFGGTSWSPVWHPGGLRLAVTTMRKGDFDMFAWSFDGAGAESKLLDDGEDSSPVAWTVDGRVFFRGSEPDGSYVVKVLDPSAGGTVTTLTKQTSGAAVSLDGRMLAYAVNQAGRDQLYVRALPSGPAVQVSAEGGSSPAFHPRKTELFYRRGTRLYAVSWRDENGGPQFAPERFVADIRLPATAYDTTFAAAPDGRVLALVRSADAPPVTVRVILGWASSLAK